MYCDDVHCLFDRRVVGACQWLWYDSGVYVCMLIVCRMCMCLYVCRLLCDDGVYVHGMRTVCCTCTCQLHMHVDTTTCMLLNHHDYCIYTHNCLFRYTSTHRCHHTVHRMRHAAYGIYVCVGACIYWYCECGCVDRMCELVVCICYMLMCSMCRLHRIDTRYMCCAAYRISIIGVWLYH